MHSSELQTQPQQGDERLRVVARVDRLLEALERPRDDLDALLLVVVAKALDAHRGDAPLPLRLGPDALEAHAAIISASTRPPASAAAKNSASWSRVRPMVRAGSPLAR